MLSELLNRRVLILLGKGGVGRTTVAAALGSLVARDGGRVLLIESDQRAPIAALFGREPAYNPIEVEPGLFLLALDGPRALEQYLTITLPSPRLVRAVLASRLYEYFVQAAPGLRELIMIGKLYHEIERRPAGPPPWNLVIFDAPASGQALDLLRMPLAARETFGFSIVGREARNVVEFLRDGERCAVVQVTTAEPLAVSETIETHGALTEIGFGPAAVIFNRAVNLPFSARDIDSMTRRAAKNRRLREVAPYIRMTRAQLRSQTRAKAELNRIRRKTGAYIIETSDWPELSGLDLVNRLTQQLGRLIKTQTSTQSVVEGSEHTGHQS